ncbi:NAD(P)-dependent oxidoreductase [Sphingobium lignivorans]|uniref:D-3-phosphoglycerate dehydrogenase n=1 Tax=Sphingobium lignivorans TaxID=2735886 RepID=A0ABR6NJX1_9SPHN|nr:NAD(P)-dependent oxidoreductase [Sphingobium lignivorans]MBB5987568.1 D-3-phosphoglycerate dehydrogenase [Sphingobium lignivorans]
MPRVAVTFPYFDFFPDLRAELSARYPGTKFPDHRRVLEGQELIDFLQGYDTAVIGVQRYEEAVLKACPELKVISLCSAGVDHIDPALLRKYGIRMWWQAGINRVSVSELAVSYMVLALRRVHEFSSILRAGQWRGPIGFGTDLRGKTVGVHGVGHIGKAVIELLQGYKVHILASDRLDVSAFTDGFDNVELVSAEEMWARSDVLTIHLSKNATTIGLYDGAVLDQLKPGAVIVNCARGGMFDENALAERLESGRIAAAAFDVYAMEPANGNRLLDMPTFFGSPHIGATTRESWGAMLRSGIHGIEHAYEPEPGVYPFD